jgi:WD40 repeat protein
MGPRYARRFYTDYDMTAGQVMQWDTTTGALKHAVAGLHTELAAVYPSPMLDRALVVSGEHADRAEWHDLDTGKSLGELGVKASHFAPSPDARFLAAIHANAVGVWDTTTGKRLADLGTNPAPHPPQFTPDGEWLVYRQAGMGVNAVRVSSGKERLMHKSAEPGTPLPLPSGDGFVSRCVKFEYMAGDICLFLDGRRIRFAATDKLHSRLVISPDGKWVASGQYEQHRANPVFLWRVPTPKPLDEKRIKNGVFPPEEQRVEPRLMHGHAERVTAVAFSPDGKTLATGGTDRVIRLWDVETATLRAVLWAAPSPDPDAAPSDWVAFTPTGFFAGTDRGRAFLRNVLPDHHRPDVVKTALAGK